MLNLSKRVAKLEEGSDGPQGLARVFTIKSNGASTAAIDAFLLEKGFVYDDVRDDIIHLHIIYEDRNGEAERSPIYIELLNVSGAGN